MCRSLLSRLFSASLIFLISAGGGGLPVLDGLIFHSRDRAPEALRPHYEAMGGCHSDGCAIRSTAHLARFTPAVGPGGPTVSAPEIATPAGIYLKPLPNSLTGQPLSRAPPLFG